MLRSLLIALCLSLPVALAPASSIAVDIHNLEGAWARYRVATDHVSLPLIDALTLSTPRVESTPDGDAVWFQMEASWEHTRVFALAVLVSDLSFLEGTGAPSVVHRYILWPEEGDPLEYVDRATGDAYLPRFGLFDGLLPVAPTGSPVPLFQVQEFLGRALAIEAGSARGATMLSGFESPAILELNDRVLIGSSRPFRDDGTGREMDYQYYPPRVGDYRYVPLDATDYDEMIEAGFNMFRVTSNHLDHVMSEPVFFLLHEGTTEVPELLYRSNYWGGVMYVDEPEVRILRRRDWRETEDPEVAAQALVEFTTEMLEGSTKYGSRFLETMLAEENWDLGARVDLTEATMPSWMAFCGTGWYQREAGLQSVIHECRVEPADDSANVLETFGVDFPAEDEPWILFELGMATGAVQQFGGDWGVSVFGQMEDTAADLLFPMAYERGARYFWVWTSDKDHHLPHERQLTIVRDFRDWLEGEPGHRPRESRPLVAITIPWGYNLDHSNFKGDGFLWWGTRIRLDDVNDYGIQYGNVLAAVYRTYAERFAAGEEVDLIYVRPGEVFEGEGYDAVYRVLPTGGVQTETTSSPLTASSALPLHVRPNPFVGGTSLRFGVPRNAVTEIRVYDTAGRLVRTVLDDSHLEAGDYVFRWNGRDDSGLRVSSGVYFAHVVAGERTGTKKLVLLR